MNRRGFIGAALGVAGSGALLPLAPGVRARASGRPYPGPAASPPTAAAGLAPVVGYRLDRPYLDRSGTAQVYQPPAGARSGEGLAESSAADFIGQFGY
jgi:hypothetical protein